MSIFLLNYLFGCLIARFLYVCVPACLPAYFFYLYTCFRDPAYELIYLSTYICVRLISFVYMSAFLSVYLRGQLPTCHPASLFVSFCLFYNFLSTILLAIFNTFLHISLTSNLYACLPAGLPTHPHTNLHTYLPICLPAYLPAEMPAYQPIYRPACLFAYLPTYSPTWLPTYRNTYVLTYLPTYLTNHLLTCLPP